MSKPEPFVRNGSAVSNSSSLNNRLQLAPHNNNYSGGQQNANDMEEQGPKDQVVREFTQSHYFKTLSRIHFSTYYSLYFAFSSTTVPIFPTTLMMTSTFRVMSLGFLFNGETSFMLSTVRTKTGGKHTEMESGRRPWQVEQ